jgi:tRNA modification GTPase
MYELNDTIVAVSSPTPGRRVIVRLTGPKTVETCGQIFRPSIPKESSAVISGSVGIDPKLKVDAKLYLFSAPHSYTGDDVAEIHVHTNPSVTDALMGSLLNRGLRMAGPGEFTARAYLNGKIDLAQAEAVNEVIVSSNRYQLAAAEKLLSGRLAETTIKIRSEMCDCLGLIEAGLDFSQEDIEFITREEGVEKLAKIKKQLEQLLSGSISYEAVIDLPAVGIAGAPNAGKSSLLNKLLRKPRSIISDQRRTTRDVLTGLLTLRHCRCVLFDCAGLTQSPTNILDELAQQAAIEALQNSTVVIFCIDISKGTPFCNKSQNGNPPDWAEDIAIRRLIEPKVLIAVATKSDLLSKDELAECLTKLNGLFGADFLATSAEAGTGIELLKDTIDSKLLEKFEIPRVSGVALTARHRQAVIEAIENISESISEIKAGNDEVAAMMLRAAYQAISNIESASGGNIDERVLDNIFSRFCIGK